MPQLDQQLDTSEFRLAWLAAILDSAGNGIVIIDERSMIRSFNPAAERIFGYKRSEVIGERAQMLMPEPYRSGREPYLTAFFSTGRKKAVGTRREVIGRRKDGAEFPLELCVAELHSTRGRFFTAILHDITERRRAEESLRFAAEITQKMAEGVDLIRVSDGAIVYANPASERIFGYARDELIGRHATDLNARGDKTPEDTEAEINRGVEQDGSWSGEIRNVRKDGVRIWTQATVSKFEHHEYGTVFITVRQDITERKRAEEALRGSEARFRRAVVDAPLPIMIHAEDGEVVQINQIWTELTGYTHDDIPTLADWTKVAYGQRQNVARSRIDKLYAIDGRVHEGEYTPRMRDGRVHVWDFSSSPLGKLPDGRRLVLSVALDVTERKHAEDQLRRARDELERRVAKRTADLTEANERLRSEMAERKQAQTALAASEKRSRTELAELQHIYDAAPVGLCLMDTNLRYLRINQWLADINGVSIEEHIGRTLRDIVPEIAESVEPVYRKVLETGEPTLDVLATGATPADPQDVRHFMASYYPLKSAAGVVWGLSSIVRDVTEHKRAEDELRRSEERYRQLVANIHDALIVDDEQGRLTYANERFFELFGFSADDLPSIQLKDYVTPAYHEKLRDLHDRRMRGEEVPRQFDYEGMRKDGSSLWLEVCVTPITKDGVVIGTQSLIRDATSRKRAEEKLRCREAELAHATRLSAVGELATGIAHELNQPLATIVNYAESARLRLDQDPGSRSKETGLRLEKIAAQAKRAGEIIDHMRQLLRSKQPQWSVVDLNECATVIVELIEPEARLKGVSVRLRLADDNPAVSGDGIQIQQVLLNLVRNGMDAIADRPADAHTLMITTELVDNGLVRCSVCDSGVGLSDDNRDRLFKPFHTTKSDGLGLGLSVSRWIIEAHGGQISAAQRPGGGAVFSFVLPIVQEDDHGGR